MDYSLSKTMREAIRLMQTGDLLAATAAIQGGLKGSEENAAFRPGHAGDAPVKPWIDAEYRVVDSSHPAPIADPPDRAPPREIPDPPGGQFQQHSFTCAAGTRRYKLFVPGGHPGRQLPLLVMLHGCTQSPDDFARGTRMNQLAEDGGYCVAYPAQSARDNPTKCWNWFRPGDQCRDRGEPAIIAELTRHVVRTHGLNPARVYVAGLSAGAAMAVILARTYPDIYAAAGVHSGLPYRTAHDVPSAFAAMKQGSDVSGAGADAPSRTFGAPVPTIVFHGDRDTVVDPRNGEGVIAQSMASPGDSAGGVDSRGENDKQVEHGVVPGGYSYTRTVLRDSRGCILAEQWLVHGAGHAWFGGDPAGSYTDPKGPDASVEMLRFFAAHEKKHGTH
jgi:poly(hydroxyalkanoate) depolymerase family esterase